MVSSPLMWKAIRHLAYAKWRTTDVLVLIEIQIMREAVFRFAVQTAIS